MKTKRRQIPKKNRELIINRDGKKCFYCGSTERLTVDHIIPLKHGGSNLASNMIASCHSCNSTKNGNRLLPKFEKLSLDKAYLGNVDYGIPQDKDMSYLGTLVGKRKGRRKTSQDGDSEKAVNPRKKMWKRNTKDLDAEYRLEQLFSISESVYFHETTDSDESIKLSYRIKKRKSKYFSAPCNKNGGRVFLCDKQDTITPSIPASLDDSVNLVQALARCNYPGNRCSSAYAPPRPKKMRPW